MSTLRTPETDKKYKDLIAHGHLAQGCRLCDITPTKQFTYWKIIPNEFPYDRIAAVHHMIVPLRHITEEGLSEEEKRELFTIKNTYISDTYELIIEPVESRKTIPPHFHLHLVISKDLIG